MNTYAFAGRILQHGREPLPGANAIKSVPLANDTSNLVAGTFAGKRLARS